MPARPAPVVQPAAVPPARPGGGGLLQRIGGSRNGAIIAAGGTVGLIALLTLVRGKSSSSSGSDAQATPIQAYDSGPYDQWDAWQQEYDGLAGRVSTLENPPASTPPPATTPPLHITPLPAPKGSTPVVRPPTPVSPVKATKPVTKPPPKLQTVTVKKGDTLSGIAAKYHISLATLKKLNPVYWTNAKYKSGNRIWAGDKVKV